MFYDVDDLEVIVDTQHGICYVELPLDVPISTIEKDVILPKCEVYNLILILTIERLLVCQTQHATATSTMVFTSTHTTAFFTEAGQLAITLDTRVQLAT